MPVPDPAAVLEAVAARVDAVEAALERLDGDVAALGRGLGGINAALRDLADRHTGPGVAGDGPRDWATIADPVTAAAWLDEAVAWVEAVWTTIAGHPLTACWPWHPRAVIEVHALMAVRGAAYAAGPGPVVDFQHRHLPDGIDALDRILRACHRAGSHVDAAGVRHDTDPACLPALAAWWALERTGSPPGVARAHRERA